MRTCARLVLSCLAVGLWWLVGCQSAQEKCAQARGEARAAWDGYLKALQDAIDEAERIDRASAQAIREHEKRLAASARANADRLYAPGSSAWLRGYEAALRKACTVDAACAADKGKAAEARLRIDDFSERLAVARAARGALDGPVAKARERANAAIIHAGYPQLKAAQAATDKMAELCAALAPPSE